MLPRFFPIAALFAAAPVLGAGLWSPISSNLIEQANAAGGKSPWPGGCSGVVANRLTGDVTVKVVGFGLWRSSDRGQTWRRIDNNTISGRDETGWATSVDQDAPERMASFSLDGTAGWTTDGSTWKSFTSLGRNWDFGSVDWASPVPKTIIAAKHETSPPGEVYLTTDGGSSWNKLAIYLGEARDRPGMVGALDSNVLIYSKGDGIYRSTDAGVSWSKVSSVNPQTRIPVLFKGAHYLGTATGLLVSTDKGASWQQRGAPVDIWEGPFFGQTEKEMAVAGKEGVFTSENSGETWLKAAGLKSKEEGFLFSANWFGCYAWDSVNKLLYASAMGNTVFSTSTRPAAPSAIAAALKPFVDSHSLAGAVTLVANKDQVLDLETTGFSDVSSHRAMESNSLFWIASQSKPMTAAAFMILVDEGKVHLDDAVEMYLPEFKGQMLTVEHDGEHVLLRKPAHPITIREILSHTSGLPFSTPMEQPTLDGLRLRDAVRSYAMTPLQFPPGSKYQYSNAGINTAGRIIEVVSRIPYEQFIEERLFKPLQMRDTTFWPNAEQLQRLAKSYKPNPDKTDLEETTVTQLHYPLSDRQHRYPMPAGGLFSTAEDVAKFCQMILNGGVCHGKRILSDESVQQMTRKQTAQEISESYGLGFSTSVDGCGHGGAYATNMTIDRRHGLILIWMVQHAGFPRNGDKSQEAFKKAAISMFETDK